MSRYAIPRAEEDYPTARELVRWLRPDEGGQFSLPHAYIMRLLLLRKQRRVGIIFAEQGTYYVSNNAADPWGTKELIPVPKLIALIEFLEHERDREAV